MKPWQFNGVKQCVDVAIQTVQPLYPLLPPLEYLLVHGSLPLLPNTLSRAPSFLESGYKIDIPSLWEGLSPANPMWLLLYDAQVKSFLFISALHPPPQY